MGTRRFELVEGTSSKFWEIAIEGDAHTVRFGRIGTNGQSKTKSFASTDDARADADRLVKEKLGKGYREIAGEAAPPKPKTQPGVRTTLKPPRGQKPIVVVLSGARLMIDGATQDHESPAAAKKALDAFMRARMKEGFTMGATELVGDERPPEPEEYVHVPDGSDPADPPTIEMVDGKWRVTFLGDEKVSEKTCRDVISKLVKDGPRVVQIVCDFASPGSSWPKALAKTKLPTVKGFIFDTYFQTQTRQERNSLGDLGATLDACPELERLFATGDLAIAKGGTHTKLRELRALGNALSPSFLRALGGWRLPALEVLVLSLASDAAPGDDAATLEAVTNIDAPSLRTVQIEALEDVVATLAALVASPRWKSWKVVCLDGGVEEDALLAFVEKHADALASLEVLGLALGDEMSSEGEETLRARCPAIRDLSELPEGTLPATYETWRG
jgi:predicted DNA-binding WGR domain protein